MGIYDLMPYSTGALVLAFLADRVLGDPPSRLHVIAWVGKLIAALEHRLYREGDDDARKRRAGSALVILALLACLPVTLVILGVGYWVSPWVGMLVDALIGSQLLAARSLSKASLAVHASLEEDDLPQARENLSMIVGRDVQGLGVEGIARAAVETVAENTSDGEVAPFFWMVLGGCALGLTYKVINTLDSMVGYKSDRYLHFGRAAAKLDDAANFIPARVCAHLMIAMAGVCGLDHDGARRIHARDRLNHASPNSAQTESVCAGALGIQLGGDASYLGKVCRKPTIGDPTRPVEVDDIVRANRLMLATSNAALVAGVAVRMAIWGGCHLATL